MGDGTHSAEPCVDTDEYFIYITSEIFYVLILFHTGFLIHLILQISIIIFLIRPYMNNTA